MTQFTDSHQAGNSAATTNAGESPLAFHQARLRKDLPATMKLPIRGFGPEGNYTLWIPSAKSGAATVFKDGKPITVVAESCLTDPHIMTLRDRVIRTVSSRGPGRVFVGAEFLEYVAAVLRINYELTDEDLGFLLLGGIAWHEAMYLHLLGGTEVIPKSPQTVAEYVPPTIGNVAYAPPATKPVPPRSWWRRWFGR